MKNFRVLNIGGKPRLYVAQSEAYERVTRVKTTPHHSLGHVTRQQLFFGVAPCVNRMLSVRSDLCTLYTDTRTADSLLTGNNRWNLALVLVLCLLFTVFFALPSRPIDFFLLLSHLLQWLLSDDNPYCKGCIIFFCISLYQDICWSINCFKLNMHDLCYFRSTFPALRYMDKVYVSAVLFSHGLMVCITHTGHSKRKVLYAS